VGELTQGERTVKGGPLTKLAAEPFPAGSRWRGVPKKFSPPAHSRRCFATFRQRSSRTTSC